MNVLPAPLFALALCGCSCFLWYYSCYIALYHTINTILLFPQNLTTKEYSSQQTSNTIQVITYHVLPALIGLIFPSLHTPVSHHHHLLREMQIILILYYSKQPWSTFDLAFLIRLGAVVEMDPSGCFPKQKNHLTPMIILTSIHKAFMFCFPWPFIWFIT